MCELFKVVKTRAYHQTVLRASNTGIPYITRKSINNGLKDCVEAPDTHGINRANTITLGGENADFFYQPFEYITGNNMNVISHDKLNQYNGLFLVNVFRQSIKNCGFGYGLGLTGSRFLRRLIRLPVDSSGKPNWQFMEDYIKARDEKKRLMVLKYCKEQLNRILAQSNGAKVDLHSVKWKAFKIEDVFEIKSGVRLTKKAQQTGKIPFIGASDSNNGITSFVSNRNSSTDKNVLGVNYNGSVVHSFYHPYTCVFSDDVKRLHLKEKSYANREVYLFIKQMIFTQKVKYAYGYKFNAERMRRQPILLPTSSSDKPDFMFMQNFILQEEAKLYKKIIERFEN